MELSTDLKINQNDSKISVEYLSILKKTIKKDIKEFRKVGKDIVYKNTNILNKLNKLIRVTKRLQPLLLFIEYIKVAFLQRVILKISLKLSSIKKRKLIKKIILFNRLKKKFFVKLDFSLNLKELKKKNFLSYVKRKLLNAPIKKRRIIYKILKSSFPMKRQKKLEFFKFYDYSILSNSQYLKRNLGQKKRFRTSSLSSKSSKETQLEDSITSPETPKISNPIVETVIINDPSSFVLKDSLYTKLSNKRKQSNSFDYRRSSLKNDNFYYGNYLKMIEENSQKSMYEREILIKNSLNYDEMMFYMMIPINTYVDNLKQIERMELLYKEYVYHKTIEKINPDFINKTLFFFENQIIIPLYQKICYKTNVAFSAYNYIFRKYRNIIISVLSKEIKEEIQVEPYGSFANNFLLEFCDIDICIVTNNPSSNEFKNLLEILSLFLKNKKIASVKPIISNSRFLLLKTIDIESGLNVDITVHCLLPILNTKLIKLYSEFDQRVHVMGLYLKNWAKINNVVGSVDFYLSSYALMIMLIYFLQNMVFPKVLPNLQKINHKKEIYEYFHHGRKISVNTHFEKDLLVAQKHLLEINKNKVNTDSVSKLLLKFFEYYSYCFDSYNMKISISKNFEETFKNLKDNYAFSIDDPFDEFHNPGKSMYINSHTYENFLEVMKTEINYILRGEYVKRLENEEKI